MTKAKIWWPLWMGSFLLSSVAAAPAVDLVHVVTLNLKLTSEIGATQKGDIVTFHPFSFRLMTLDFVAAVGAQKGTPLSVRSQVLLIRRNAGTSEEITTLVIRQPGAADIGIDEYLTFNSSSGLVTGQANDATGRQRATLISPSQLNINLPNDLDLELTGLTTEKRATILINREEIDTGLNSSTSTFSGNGNFTGDLDNFVIAEGTLTVGVGKVIKPPPVP